MPIELIDYHDGEQILVLRCLEWVACPPGSRGRVPDLPERGVVLAAVKDATRRARARWPAKRRAILDRGSARRPGEFRPGRRNGSQPNRETPQRGWNGSALPTPNSEEARFWKPPSRVRRPRVSRQPFLSCTNGRDVERARIAPSSASPRRGTSGSRSTCTGKALILLCHKVILRVARWQHGQRGRVLAMARAIATRTDVIEVGT